jgi:hypothetical protein
MENFLDKEIEISGNTWVKPELIFDSIEVTNKTYNTTESTSLGVGPS